MNIPEDATTLAGFVARHKGATFNLKKPTGVQITIASLDDTVYKDARDTVNSWGKFYLPETTDMQVFGIVKGSSYPGDQPVVMTCKEDRLRCNPKRVYLYDDGEDTLYLVALSMKKLCEDGIKEYKLYYKGDTFKDTTEDDWAEVRKGSVGQRLDAEHSKLVAEAKTRMLENLRRQRLMIHKDYFELQ